jgi:hypothetical protein
MSRTVGVFVVLVLAAFPAVADSYCMTCNGSGACESVGYDSFRQCMSMGGACRAWDPCTTEGCSTNTVSGEDSCWDPFHQSALEHEPEALLADSAIAQWQLVGVRVVTPRPSTLLAATR